MTRFLVKMTNISSVRSNIQRGEKFDFSNITFSELKKYGTGPTMRQMIFLNDAVRGKILVQTPKMDAPFGFKSSEFDVNGEPRTVYDIPLMFPTMEEMEQNRPDLLNFVDAMDRFNQYVAQTISENSLQWVSGCKRQWSIDTAETNLKKNLLSRYTDKDGKEHIVLRLTLDQEYDENKQFTGNFSNGRQPILVCNENREPVEFNLDNATEVVPAGSQIIALLECSVMNVRSSEFRVKWRPVQFQVFKGNSSRQIINQIVLLDDSEENETSSTQVSQNVASTTQNMGSSAQDAHEQEMESGFVDDDAQECEFVEQESVDDEPVVVEPVVVAPVKKNVPAMKKKATKTAVAAR